MSVIYCDRCDRLVDSDYVECVENPDVEFGMMCLDHKHDDDDERAELELEVMAIRSEL